MIDFKCEQCGACCKAVGCKLLTDDNKCPMYETRPDICNTSTMFDSIYSKSMSEQEYLTLSKQCCEQLRQKVEV